MDIALLKQLDEYAWQVEPHGRMCVPAIFYASEELVRQMDDKVYEQLRNVTMLPGLVGAVDLSAPARLLLLSVLGSLALFPLTPLSSLLSRRHEHQADRYATDLTGTPGELASAFQSSTEFWNPTVEDWL